MSGNITANTTVVGIDWSITSPAWTVLTNDYVPEFHFFTGPSVLKKNPPFSSPDKRYYQFHIYPGYENDQERFDLLARMLWYSIAGKPNPKVYLEGYSYAARGLVFNIAESTGVLKHLLWTKAKIVPEIVPSTHWKAFHGMKGNAEKREVVENFVARTGINLYNDFNIKPEKKNLGVLTDIADSFWIANYGWCKEDGHDYFTEVK